MDIQWLQQEKDIERTCQQMHQELKQRGYTVTNLLGNGAFSYVFEAEAGSRSFALKVIHPTTKTSRIKMETAILKEARLEKWPNVIPLEDCFQLSEEVGEHPVLVFPLLRPIDFAGFAMTCSLDDIRSYMVPLFQAVEAVHNKGYIHRDIKPRNFLFYESLKGHRTGVLIDFGLTEYEGRRRLDSRAMEKKAAALQHSKRALPDCDAAGSKRLKVNASKSLHTVAADAGSAGAPRPVHPSSTPSPSPSRPVPRSTMPVNPPSIARFHTPSTPAIATPAVAFRTKQKPLPRTAALRQGKVGRVVTPRTKELQWATPSLKQARPLSRRGIDKKLLEQRAARAGTAGYRPPEVLMTVKHQTTAVDIWACGIILLGLATQTPRVHSPARDDMELLVEIGELVGWKPLKQAAAALGKKISFQNVDERSLKRKGENVIAARVKIARPNDSFEEVDELTKLVLACLDPNPKTRITATQALKHPFFKRAHSPEVRSDVTSSPEPLPFAAGEDGY